MATDLSNWRVPEHNQWSFQNVDEIIETDAIREGTKKSPLNSKPISLDDFKIQLQTSP